MLKLNNLPIIIGCILGLLIVYKGGNEMGNSGWGIVIALIGVAGTLLMHFFQFRKDSNTIGKVKEDTSTMIPEVNNIDENTKKIRDQVIERMVPSLDQLMETKSGVAALVDELKYQKRLKYEMSPYIHNMDSLISGIQNVYEENAKLSSELKEEKLLSQRLTLENINLRQELDTYKNRTKIHDQGLER
jgi:DNA integrity scanning protein DisA with diadenylate cyclase activity